MSGRNLALALLLTAVSGAGSVTARAGQTAPSGNPDKKSTPGGKDAPIMITVTTDKKVYPVGAAIHLTLTARNTTQEAIHLTFSSGQRYDFEIRSGAKSDGALIWQWSRGMGFVQMLSGDTLEPNKPKTYHAVFDPRETAKAGKPVSLTPGTYTIVGTLTIMQKADRPSGVATIRVK